MIEQKKVAGNHKYNREKDSLNSLQSSLKSHPFWVSHISHIYSNYYTIDLQGIRKLKTKTLLSLLLFKRSIEEDKNKILWS